LATETKPAEKKTDWEKEFFDKHGITDDKEKDAIRGRARVLAYDRARRRAEEKEENEKPSNGDKKWWQD
jgi:hypothetical protein